jgi:transposase-like protein
VDPLKAVCHNPDCANRGQEGKGNIYVHSRCEKRYGCRTCGRTFAATVGTALYRLRTAPETVALVLTLLCHGCPLQAIVAAFGFDERTVAAWQQRAGEHCQGVHEAVVMQGQVELEHVQADELWVKLVGQKVWMAMAMAVPCRLWLGGLVSAHRDSLLIRTVAQQVKACAKSFAFLLCVDGLASYVTAFTRTFRHRLRTGRRGRPRLLIEPGLLIAQVIKRCAQRHVVEVTRRVVRGTEQAILAVLQHTDTGRVINTAYIERLNATFRAHLAPLARRSRAIARRIDTINCAMYLVGCAYNFCWPHDTLTRRHPLRQPCTPAMAAGLTDHPWSLMDLLVFPIAPTGPVTAARPPPKLTKRRGEALDHG